MPHPILILFHHQKYQFLNHNRQLIRPYKFIPFLQLHLCFMHPNNHHNKYRNSIHLHHLTYSHHLIYSLSHIHILMHHLKLILSLLLLLILHQLNLPSLLLFLPSLIHQVHLQYLRHNHWNFSNNNKNNN